MLASLSLKILQALTKTIICVFSQNVFFGLFDFSDTVLVCSFLVGCSACEVPKVLNDSFERTIFIASSTTYQRKKRVCRDKLRLFFLFETTFEISFRKLKGKK